MAEDDEGNEASFRGRRGASSGTGTRRMDERRATDEGKKDTKNLYLRRIPKGKKDTKNLYLKTSKLPAQDKALSAGQHRKC
jgi:hypothetical protein